MRMSLLLIVMVVQFVQLPAPARAQSGTEVSPAIQVHPGVATILQLPDEIEAVWSIGGGEVMVKGVGSKVYLRPRPDTPAGVEVFIEVKTRTLHRIFLLRVVDRAEDAAREVTVPAAAATPGGGATAPEAPRDPPALPEPAASAPASPPGAPDADHASAPERAEPATERAALASGSPPFDLSVHAVVALAGATAVEIAGYEPDDARQSHRALGVRLAGMPRGAWWSLEANISGEWLAAPTVHGRNNRELMRREVLVVSGPWLRADVGMRVRFGTRWMPTAYAGLGVQAHFRVKEKSIRDPMRPEDDEISEPPVQDMPFGGALALGLGLQFRAGDVLLGVELHMREGGPGDYRSVAALWSVGCFLNQGD